MLPCRSFLLSSRFLPLAVVIGGLLALLVPSGECDARDKSVVYARWWMMFVMKLSKVKTVRFAKSTKASCEILDTRTA